MPPRTYRRTAIFHRESTRLRSNVADQVQRDLLPAGRMLSVFLVLCELLAEVAVLAWSHGQQCNRPLRFWVCVLMMLQMGTVLLNCLNIWQGGRDSFGQHRNGLSASDLDMYTDSPAAPPPPPSRSGEGSSVVVDVVNEDEDATEPLTAYEEWEQQQQRPAVGFATSSSSGSLNAGGSGTSGISTEVVDRYVRIVNAWYLLWFILGSFWVTTGEECAKSAPHLYRLVVALAIIYYALLLLPLACFCLIVCCLPLFILVYRIMLPYAERERRRARAADPAQVQNLSSIVYSAATFASHTGNESLEDASCVICLCEYEPDEVVRFLPCKHHFHKDCVDVWLRLDKACCLCKQDIDATTQTPPV